MIEAEKNRNAVGGIVAPYEDGLPDEAHAGRNTAVVLVHSMPPHLYFHICVSTPMLPHLCFHTCYGDTTGIMNLPRVQAAI